MLWVCKLLLHRFELRHMLRNCLASLRRVFLHVVHGKRYAQVVRPRAYIATGLLDRI